MKKVFDYLKTRPLAFVSLIFIALLYFVMIFAEFFAPYNPNRSFENCSFHPANIEFSPSSASLFSVREMRVLSLINFKYARVKGLSHNLKFFAKGEKYRLLGFIPCSRHLFTTMPDAYTGEEYPVFLFGADDRGRDLYSRIVFGSRISLTIGFVASFISLFLAIILGGFSGFYGGVCDFSIMRLSEFFMLIPGLYLILFLRSLLGSVTEMAPGQVYMIITIILSLVGWPGSARTLRGMIHAIKREEFVLDAVLEGVPGIIVIFRHIMPQITSLLIVSTTLAIPGFIMSETTLSYLGLGIADPSVSWGSLINRNIATLSNLKNFPWLLLPVLMLLFVTLAFNFVGDALRDYFDPYHIYFKKAKRQKGGESLPLAQEKNSCATPSSGGADDYKTAPATPPSFLTKDILLCVRNLNVSFKIMRGNKSVSIHSVRGVSFKMKHGEILGIVGESGSGKTVTTSAIPGLHPSNATVSGEIYYNLSSSSADFVDLVLLSDKELRSFRGKKIGMIFQEPGRSFDPLQNMESVFLETFRNSTPEITREGSLKKASQLLLEVGISDPLLRLKNFPHQFSGGQLQRIGIALALAQGCELLIADEPTTALDVTIQAQIVELLKKLNETRNLSIIFISHNINLVSELCSSIIVMYGGLIMESGSSSKIMASPSHPYTKALLASTPKFGAHYTTSRLVSIPGRVSDPANPVEGCPFCVRCPHAKKECATVPSGKKVRSGEDCIFVLQPNLSDGENHE